MSEKAPKCTGNCSVEATVIAAQHAAKKYEDYAEQNGMEKKEMAPEVKVICARAAFMAEVYDALPNEECAGNVTKSDGTLQCRLYESYTKLQEVLSINTMMFNEDGTPIVDQETLNGVTKNATERNLGQQQAANEANAEFIKKTAQPPVKPAPQQPYTGTGNYI